MEIIGLSGYARSGKDEAAAVLVEEFGFTRVAFADKLREFLYALNPMVVGLPTPESHFPPYLPLQYVIDDWGWNGYKESRYSTHIRQLLQRLGTEAGRETLWDSIWIDAAFAGLDQDAKVVVTDARFENEAKAIKERGGKIWRIVRDGVGPANNHISETGLDDWKFDYMLWNNSDLESYRTDVRESYEMVLKDKREWLTAFLRKDEA